MERYYFRTSKDYAVENKIYNVYVEGYNERDDFYFDKFTTEFDDVEIYTENGELLDVSHPEYDKVVQLISDDNFEVDYESEESFYDCLD